MFSRVIELEGSISRTPVDNVASTLQRIQPLRARDQGCGRSEFCPWARLSLLLSLHDYLFLVSTCTRLFYLLPCPRNWCGILEALDLMPRSITHAPFFIFLLNKIVFIAQSDITPPENPRRAFFGSLAHKSPSLLPFSQGNSPPRWIVVRVVLLWFTYDAVLASLRSCV